MDLLGRLTINQEAILAALRPPHMESLFDDTAIGVEAEPEHEATNPSSAARDSCAEVGFRSTSDMLSADDYFNYPAMNNEGIKPHLNSLNDLAKRHSLQLCNSIGNIEECDISSGQMFQRRVIARYYSTEFGSAMLTSWTQALCSSEGTSKRKQPRGEPTKGWMMKVIPSRFMSSGIEATVSWAASSADLSRYRKIQCSLRYFPAVSSTAQIFEACKIGDIQWLRSLFQRGEASPFDTDPHGWTPLHVSQNLVVTCIAMLSKPLSCPGQVAIKNRKVSQKLTMTHQVAAFWKRGNICELLIKLGADTNVLTALRL